MFVLDFVLSKTTNKVYIIVIVYALKHDNSKVQGFK